MGTEQMRIAQLERELAEVRAESFKAGMERATEICDDPYSSETDVRCSDEPSIVGTKIAATIRAEAAEKGKL